MRPLTAIGDARWADNLGFMQPGAPPADSGVTSGTVAAPRVGSLSLDVSMMRLGFGSSRLNATNDGVTADETAFSVMNFTLDQRIEWRKPGALLGPWLDFGMGVLHGSRTLEQGGYETSLSMSMTALQVHGRFGVDAIPIEYVGVGPFAGAFLDFYDATLKNDDASSSFEPTDSGFAPDVGPVFGLHARLRTKARPGQPSRFYVDPALTWRLGRYNNARYASVETGVRAGSSVYLVGWYEQRLGASGHFSQGPDGSDADATNLSEAFAASMPVDRRVGLAIAFVL